MKLRIGDAIVIAIVIIAALAIWLFPQSGGIGRFAEVRVDGKLMQTLDLRGKEAEYTFSGVTVKAGDGCVYASHAECPDLVCVRSGKISKPGQAIVCVPNRVSIEIKGEAEVDAIVGG